MKNNIYIATMFIDGYKLIKHVFLNGEYLESAYFGRAHGKYQGMSEQAYMLSLRSKHNASIELINIFSDMWRDFYNNLDKTITDKISRINNEYAEEKPLRRYKMTREEVSQAQMAFTHPLKTISQVSGRHIIDMGEYVIKFFQGNRKRMTIHGQDVIASLNMDVEDLDFGTFLSRDIGCLAYVKIALSMLAA